MHVFVKSIVLCDHGGNQRFYLTIPSGYYMRQLPPMFLFEKFLPFIKSIKTKEKEFKLQDSYTFQGLKIDVENEAGSYRRGQDKNGKKWQTKMDYDYGFIRGTEATDGEGVDAFVNNKSDGTRDNYHKGEGEPERIPQDAYVIHQHKIDYSGNWPNGTCPDCKKHHTECNCKKFYDEDKVMLGFDSKEEAIKAYLQQYDSNRFLGPVSTYTIPELKFALKKSSGKKLPIKKPKHEHWHGFDLDGTLAKYEGWQGKNHIGEPVEKVKQRIEKLLSEGNKVKIFTARASDPKAIPPIKEWLKQHNLPLLEITNKKNPGMISLYDDIAIQVRKNTGNLVKAIGTPVIEKELMQKNMGWICPHCKKEIMEKSLYSNDGKFYHRCDTTKPIILPKQKYNKSLDMILKKAVNPSAYYLNYNEMIRKIPEDSILSFFSTVNEMLTKADELHPVFGRQGETIDDFKIRKVRKINDRRFMQAGQYHNSNAEHNFHDADNYISKNNIIDRIQSGVLLFFDDINLNKSCDKNQGMIKKSQLETKEGPGNFRPMLQENLGELKSDEKQLKNLKKAYKEHRMTNESFEDFMKRYAMNMKKAFVRVPEHKRKGKIVPAYTYFTSKSKKVADVRHKTMTRVDYGKQEAAKKVEELKKKQQHHDLHIEAAKNLHEKVTAHKKAGNITYKIGEKEHHVDKVLKDLNDHIEHHTNEKQTHENHIKKIKNRHATEQAHWDKKREERQAKQKAIEELLTEKQHKGEVFNDDVLAVLKKMKSEETSKSKSKKEHKKPSKEKSMDDYFAEYNLATSKDQKASIAKKAQDKFMKDNPDATLRDFLVASKKYKERNKNGMKTSSKKLFQDLFAGPSVERKAPKSEKTKYVRKNQQGYKTSLDFKVGDIVLAPDIKLRGEVVGIEDHFVGIGPEGEYYKPIYHIKIYSSDYFNPGDIAPFEEKFLKKEKNQKSEVKKKVYNGTKGKQLDIFSFLDTKKKVNRSLAMIGNQNARKFDSQKEYTDWLREQPGYIKKSHRLEKIDGELTALWPKNKQEEELAKDVNIKDDNPKEPRKIIRDPDDARKKTSIKIEDFGEKIGGARKDTAQRGYKMSRKGDGQPAWRKIYTVAEIVDGTGKGKFSITDNRSKFGNPALRRTLFDTKEEAEKMLPIVVAGLNHQVQLSTREKSGNQQKWEIVRKVSDRKRPVIKDNFDSREEAMEYLAKNAEEIIAKNLRHDDTIHPVIEEAIRKGKDYRNGKNVTAKDFHNTFGFRGVEFGNWNNNAERQLILNNAYDSFMDLADVTGLSPKEISLNGELAIGFGSRGQGLTGSRAHYERHYGAINLTKMKGAGSLAHEWWHAKDFYLSRKSGKAKDVKEKNSRGDLVYKTSDVRTDFASHGLRNYHNISDNLRESLNSLMDKINNRDVQYTEDISKKERIQISNKERVAKFLQSFRDRLVKDYTEDKWKPYRGKRNNPATPEQLKKVDSLIAKINKGEFGEDTAIKTKSFMPLSVPKTIADLGEIYQEVRGRQPFTFKQNRWVGELSDIMTVVETQKKYDADLAETKKQKIKTKKVASNYKSEAWRLDQGRVSDYWQTNHEISARAFEAWVYDKLKSEGNRNDFLAYEKHNNIPAYKRYNAKPYPEGEERKQINKHFDDFFNTYKKGDHFSKEMNKSLNGYIV